MKASGCGSSGCAAAPPEDLFPRMMNSTQVGMTRRQGKHGGDAHWRACQQPQFAESSPSAAACCGILAGRPGGGQDQLGHLVRMGN
jgi:hypothetical protein